MWSLRDGNEEPACSNQIRSPFPIGRWAAGVVSPINCKQSCALSARHAHRIQLGSLVSPERSARRHPPHGRRRQQRAGTRQRAVTVDSIFFSPHASVRPFFIHLDLPSIRPPASARSTVSTIRLPLALPPFLTRTSTLTAQRPFSALALNDATRRPVVPLDGSLIVADRGHHSDLYHRHPDLLSAAAGHQGERFVSRSISWGQVEVIA